MRDLQRNDEEGALAYIREMFALAGKWPKDYCSTMLMMQDDPTSLILRMQALKAELEAEAAKK